VTTPLALGAAGVGLVLGLIGWWWLRRHTYRVADEAELPKRAHIWVPIATTVACWLVTASLGTRWPWWVAVGPALFAVVWLVASAIDLDVARLPNVFTLPLAGAAAVWVVLMGVLTNDWAATGRALAAGVGLAGVNLGLSLLFRLIPPHQEGFGMGDIKLCLSLGAVVGWFGWLPLGVGYVATFVFGGVWAIVLLVARRAGRHSAFSFGPFLAAGTIVAMLIA